MSILESNSLKKTPLPEDSTAGQGLPRWRTALREWEALSPNDKFSGLVRAVGVLILVAIPLFLMQYVAKPEPEILPNSIPNWIAVDWPGGRIIWTVVIAILPLFIVVIGFYAWRKICPLAFFGRMSEWLEWPDSRATSNSKLRRIRVSGWVVQNYPYITWGFLTIMLALRILILNSNSLSLAIAFAGICLLASAVSFRYTGKSWCNYFCPVGTIEKIYTDGDRPNYRSNSQCPKCTGCKTVPSGGLCPDINQENDYWQEIKSPARTWVYYAWPGTVFGFYLWYFLHKPTYWHDLNRLGVFTMRGHSIEVPNDGGTDWGYYLSGDWTRNPQPWREWLDPGFGFHWLPPFIKAIPVILAGPLTLAVLSSLSYLLFKGLEFAGKQYRIRRLGSSAAEALESVRHPLFMIAGYVAFLCFYEFAGAPTFRLLPWNLYPIMQFGVVVFATMNLSTRLRRTRTRQLQNDQARKWLKSWPLKEKNPPTDLEEAHRVVAEHLRSSEDRARVFQITIVNLISDGVLTSTELSLLERLEKDLDLSEVDKKLLMKRLGQEFPGRFSGGLFESLRLIAYRGELEACMLEARGLLPSDAKLEEMQSRYQVKAAAHKEILNELRNPDETRANLVREQAEHLISLEKDISLLAQETAPAIQFLRRELVRKRLEELDHLLEIAGLFGNPGELTAFSTGLKADDSRTKVEAVSWIAKNLPEALATIVVEAACQPIEKSLAPSPDLLSKTLIYWTQEGTRFTKSAALYALKLVLTTKNPTPDNVQRQTPNAMSLPIDRLTEALASDDALLRQASIAGLASLLTVADWKKALQDSDREVLLCCLTELPKSMVSALKPELQALAAGQDSDLSTRARALTSGGEEGDSTQTYTLLQRMFALSQMKLLANLSAETIHSLAFATKEESFQPGQTLCKEGETGDSVFLLLEGETEAIQTRNGVEQRLGINRTGESVGEMAILDPGPRMATVRPLTKKVRTLILQGEDFRTLLQRDNTVSMGVIKMLIQRQRVR